VIQGVENISKLKMALMLDRIIFLTLISISLISCCHESDDNSGIIRRNYTIGGINDINCLLTPDTACIRTDSEYRALFTIDSSSYCGTAILPEIDFSKYSLLVNRKNTLGRVYFHRLVTVDSTNRTITYEITETYCKCIDVCSSNESNIVLVPAISNDYRIIYK
jgi:hypothetical protein